MSNPILERARAHGVTLEMNDQVAVVTLSRPAKRNALSDTLIEAIRDIFQNLPQGARAAVIAVKANIFVPGLICPNSMNVTQVKGCITLEAGMWPWMRCNSVRFRW